MEIVTGIYCLRLPIPNNVLGHLNCYIIKGKDGWLMVDTGWYTDEVLDCLQKELRKLGLVLTDFTTLVLTHVHTDHYGLAGRIKEISPHTQLIAHHWETVLIESRYIKYSQLKNKMAAFLKNNGVPASKLKALGAATKIAREYVKVVFPEQYLYGGEIIKTGYFNLEVIWTPGHTPGHICLYEPVNRILFSGDHILPHITSNISYDIYFGDNPLGNYIASLHKIYYLPVSQVLPGHGNIFNNIQQRINELISHHNSRKNEIQEVILKEPRNAWEISSYVTWNTNSSWDELPLFHKRAAVTEVIAHLECMRWEGKVLKLNSNDTISYLANSGVRSRGD